MSKVHRPFLFPVASSGYNSRSITSNAFIHKDFGYCIHTDMNPSPKPVRYGVAACRSYTTVIASLVIIGDNDLVASSGVTNTKRQSCSEFRPRAQDLSTVRFMRMYARQAAAQIAAHRTLSQRGDSSSQSQCESQAPFQVSKRSKAGTSRHCSAPIRVRKHKPS